MAEEVIKVVATADVTSLNKGLDAAKKKLDGFGKSVGKTADGLKAAVPGTNQASQALTDLGRVAQDAPFGFIGIANNLNPLLESFQRLQTTTGSAGGALKALGSSLLGPAGIGIALSVVSSLFLAFGSQIVDFINKTSAAEKTQRELNKTLAEAEASVAGNVSRLQALASIAQDVSRTDAVRKEAIGALNKEYDVFNGKLDINNVNTAENISLVNKQSAALVTNAKIIGLQNLIAKTTEEKYKILNSTLTDNLSILETLKLGALSALSPVKGLTEANTQALKNQAKAIGDNANKVKFFEDELKKLLGTQAEAGDLFKEKPIKELKLKAKKVNVEATGEVSLGEETLKKQIKFGPEQKVSLAVDVEVAPKLFNKGVIAQTIQDEIERARLAAEQKIIEFNEFIARSTELVIEGSLVSFGEAIGNALSGKGDGLNGLFNSIFQIVGTQIQELVTYQKELNF